MGEHQSVDGGVVSRLEAIVGKPNVIYDEADQLERYARDEAGPLYAVTPEAVVKPKTAQEIGEILRLANETSIPVTPRGAGSGLAGGAVPLEGGVVLSCERMDRILEIDERNLVAVVEPGVVTNDLCQVVAEQGLFYAGYPMSVETSFVGGNVACNAGGAKVVKYGSTAAHVLGMEVVFPTGEVVQLGGKRRKDSSGYSMLRLLVGSEGTLGIFTQISLNLIPHPGRTADLLVPFPSVSAAMGAVSKIMMTSGVLPSAVEFIDSVSVRYCSDYTNASIPFADRAGAYLIVQLEGKSKNELAEAYEKAGEACLEHGGLEVFVADNRHASDRLWYMRRNWLEALKAADPYVGTGDIVVPISQIPRMMEEIESISQGYHIDIPCAGHAADGNIHPAVMRPAEIAAKAWKPLMEEVLSRIAVRAAELGGAVSGEHGIGFLKKELLGQTKHDEVAIMRRVKEALDPNGILNPGKVF